MPHWGMSLALGTNINDVAPADRLKQAYTHLAEAEKRKAAGSDVEQGLIAALAKRYVADPTGDQAVREKAYSDAMGELAKRFPDDLDVATLYAESLMNLRPWRLYTKDGTPEPGTEAIVASLERVMKRNRESSGRESLLHSRGRSVEDVPSAPCRRPDGWRRWCPARDTSCTCRPTSTSAPVSMRSRRRATPTRRLWTRSTSRPPTPAAPSTGRCITATTCSSSRPPRCSPGNFAQARAAAQRTVALADPIADQMVMIEPFAAQELAVLVRFGQWGPILEAKAPAPTRAMQTSLYHFARGAALAATGKAAEAEAELAALKARRRRFPKDAMVGASNHGRGCARGCRCRLTARIAEAKGDTAGAIKAFTAAIAAEDRLGYNEPPGLAESRSASGWARCCCGPAGMPKLRRCSGQI